MCAFAAARPANSRTRGALGRWLLLLIAAMPACAFGTGAIFATAFAGDGQTENWRIIDASESAHGPWSAIGNFLIPGLGGYCSGVLVAPQVVLTANHCLYAPDFSRMDAHGRPAQRLMNPKLFRFYAGVHDQRYSDAIAVERVVAGGWTPEAPEAAKDWAIAVLRRPARVAAAQVALLPYRAVEAVHAWKNKLVVAGYPGSFLFSSVLRLSFNCSLLQSPAAGVVSHDCAAAGGSSGGPILVNDDGRPRLVGIHTSSQFSDPRLKHGVSINSFLPELRATLATLETRAWPARLSPAGWTESMRLIPVVAHAHVDDKPHVEFGNLLH